MFQCAKLKLSVKLKGQIYSKPFRTFPKITIRLTKSAEDHANVVNVVDYYTKKANECPRVFERLFILVQIGIKKHLQTLTID